jgi:hypothetical protein
MKKNFLRGLTAVAAAAMVFVGCQKEQISNNPALNAVVQGAGGNCTSDCIDPEGPFFIKTSTADYDENEGTVTLKVYNTATKIVYEITSTTTIRNVRFNNVVVYTSSTPATQPYIIERDLDEEWEACDLVSAAIRVNRNNNTANGGGVSVLFNSSYSLIGLCPACTLDGNSFTGAAVECGAAREANYTFSSEDGVGYFKMQGGLTNFTVADAVVTIFDGTDDVTIDYTIVQNTPGFSSNRVISVEGALGTCSSIRVNITWGSTNSDGIITGEWTVVDANGDELAPAVADLSCN